MYTAKGVSREVPLVYMFAIITSKFSCFKLHYKEYLHATLKP